MQGALATSSEKKNNNWPIARPSGWCRVILHQTPKYTTRTLKLAIQTHSWSSSQTQTPGLSLNTRFHTSSLKPLHGPVSSSTSARKLLKDLKKASKDIKKRLGTVSSATKAQIYKYYKYNISAWYFCFGVCTSKVLFCFKKEGCLPSFVITAMNCYVNNHQCFGLPDEEAKARWLVKTSFGLSASCGFTDK